MSTDTQKLMKMKERMKELETAVSRTEGEHSQLMKSLKDEFGLTDIKKAKKKRDEMVSGLEKDKRAFQEGVEKLEKNYEWGL